MPQEDHEYGDAVGEYISTAKSNTAVAKCQQTAEFVKQLIREEKGPVVVFSDHVQSSKDLQTIIAQGDGSKGSRFRVALIIGETPMGNRSATVDKFQRGELDCLVGSIGACSTGITLTRSNIVVFNDLSWVPSRNMQALGRIYRISQARHCLSYTMVGGKMDKKIAEKLREKMKVIREIDE
jgi:superfamily II DNA or RNA helicase